MRRSDAVAAADAHTYIANSSTVSRRIQATYGISAPAVCPPRGLSPTGPRTPVPGLEPGYLLTVGRARSYKNTDVVCRAVARLAGRRLVVVGGLPAGRWPREVVGVHDVDDSTMRWLYANAAALVAVAVEDFGLTVVEAQAFGVPSVVLRDGGYLDSTVEDVTGVFVDRAEPATVARGIERALARGWDRDAIQAHGEVFAPATFAARMRALVAAATTGTPVPFGRPDDLDDAFAAVRAPGYETPRLTGRPADAPPSRLAS